MTRAAIPMKVKMADPLRPQLAGWGRTYPEEFLYWGNLLANLWGLRGLYLRQAHDYKLGRFDHVIAMVQKEGRRILPAYRAEIQARIPYLVENTLADPGTPQFEAQENGWWVGALVAAFELAKAYGIILGAGDRTALETARIWREVSSLAYRCIPDDLAANLLTQITGGRSQAPENAYELVLERVASEAKEAIG